MKLQQTIFEKKPFVIGMVHLKALPGSPGFEDSFDDVIEAARKDALSLARGGVDAIMVENFFDVPFTPNRVETETVSAMTLAVKEVIAAVNEVNTLPVGVNVLRNDGMSAMAIAAVTGASFIRVNVLAGARLTDQGIIEGIAYPLARLRNNLRANDILIMADVDVKHSAPLAPKEVHIEAEELVERSGANAIIVTGATTGRPVESSLLSNLRKHVDVPLVIGSGVTAQTAPELAKEADAFIVGTSLKEDGDIRNPVSPEKVRELMAALQEVRTR